MLARRVTGGRPRSTVLYLSCCSEDAFDLKRRLGDTAHLVVRSHAVDASRILRAQSLGTADSVVIDRRGLLPPQRQALESTVAQCRLACRVRFIDDPASVSAPHGSNGFDAQARALIPPAAIAAAVHFGRGRHELLIEAMQALTPYLTQLGRQFVSEVLGSGFLFHRVATVAAQLGTHRTRLHHRLVGSGDPPPKRLLDACYAMTMALALRDPTLHTNELLWFVRAEDLRMPREAVKRCTGMGLASLRRAVQGDRGHAVSALIMTNLTIGAILEENGRPRISCTRVTYPARRRLGSSEDVADNDANEEVPCHRDLVRHRQLRRR